MSICFYFPQREHLEDIYTQMEEIPHRKFKFLVKKNRKSALCRFVPIIFFSDYVCKKILYHMKWKTKPALIAILQKLEKMMRKAQFEPFT